MRARLLLPGLVFALVLSGCGEDVREVPTEAPTPSAPAPEPLPATAEFVGAAACAECHAAETAAWQGSHHDLAMQEPTAETVLGDFDDATFEHDGTTTRFHRDGERFLVTTPGPGGEPETFEVAYTFGVDPLQQVLLPLPGGRLQALTVAWDARPEAEGGQRWFSLYPDEKLLPGDSLHWTGIQQNWNYMCASCHSTKLRKAYDAEADRYQTTWSDLDVACEACHGPGSLHAEEPEVALPVPLSRADPRFAFAPGAVIAELAADDGNDAERETCGRCHSRRGILRETPASGDSLLDAHRVALLEPELYHADGQIEGEVYVYGSFRQSKMAAAGVRCSDCHEPHGLELRAEGNALCGQCHQASTFDTPAHHHHEVGSPGAECVSCHMPQRTYMVVDPRRDHSFRVPRPDLSVELGTPNACASCHEQGNAWASAAVESWYPEGRSQEPHFGQALAKGRAGTGDADRALLALAGDPAQPAIVRATALDLLAGWPSPATADAQRAGARDPDPLVRGAAAAAAAELPPAEALVVGAPLLRDPVGSVRIRAASALASVPPQFWRPEDRAAHASALGELRTSLAAEADRPESRFNRGVLHLQFGEIADARREYEAALRLDPTFTPAAVNLADLARQEGRDAEGEAVLREALERTPEDPGLHHALGLTLVRAQRTDEALDHLGQAATLAPERVRYAFVYGVALQSTGDLDAALRVLEAARDLRPADRDLRLALVSVHRERGETNRALDEARALAELAPGDPRVAELIQEIERGSAPAQNTP